MSFLIHAVNYPRGIEFDGRVERERVYYLDLYTGIWRYFSHTAATLFDLRASISSGPLLYMFDDSFPSLNVAKVLEYVRTQRQLAPKEGWFDGLRSSSATGANPPDHLPLHPSWMSRHCMPFSFGSSIAILIPGTRLVLAINACE